MGNEALLVPSIARRGKRKRKVDVEDLGSAYRAEEADERCHRTPQETWHAVRDRMLQEQGSFMAIWSV